MKKEKISPVITSSNDYNNMVDLLAVYSEASNRLEQMQAEANGELIEILDDKKPDYAKYQAALTEAETALELIARAHPEWFTTKQSIKTPYGTIKFHASKVLEIPNEEATIILIQQVESEDNTIAALQLVQTKEVIDKEGLEKLDDATLKRFRIKRVPKLNFSVSPAKLDMGKAVREEAAA